MSLCLLLIGCGDTRLVDPEVEYGDEPDYTVVGEPEVDSGFYVEQLYSPLRAGQPCFVVYGLQGGTWSMPAVRARGVEPEVVIEATIVTEDGELVGEVSSLERLQLSPDGWLELQALPIPVEHEAPNSGEPIDDLFGLDAELSIRVTDDAERTAERTVAVVLTEG